MSLNIHELSPELKALLLNLKNMSRMQRFEVLATRRTELGWRTVAYLYGPEKLEAQDWLIPDEELQERMPEPARLEQSDSRQRSGDTRAGGAAEVVTAEGGENPKSSDEDLETASARRRAEVEREEAAVLKRAIELNNAEGERGERGPRVERLPAGAELSGFEYEPNYVLDDDGRVRHVISVRYALGERLREQYGIPHPSMLPHQQIAFHKQQLAKLEKADQAPRCEHIFPDGTKCGSPKMKTGRLCYAHERMMEMRPRKLKLLPAEDANSVMMNLMEIGRALVDDEITERKAGLLMYQQQLALIALKGATFKQTPAGEMVRELPKSERFEDQRRAGARAMREQAVEEEGPVMKEAESERRQRVDVEAERRPPQSVKGQDGPPGMSCVSALDLGMTGEGVPNDRVVG